MRSDSAEVHPNARTERTPDPLRPYYQAMIQLKGSIEECLEKGRVIPCLTLLYSGIDVLASMERQPHEGTQHAFVRWVETYMLPNNLLRFSALDLFAARCGIIHAYSAESDLSRKGRARKIVYAWGTASADALQQAGHALGRSEITVHVRELIDGFGIAIIKYIDDVADNPILHQRFFESTRHWLVGVDSSTVTEFLAVRKSASELANSSDQSEDGSSLS